MTNVAKIINFPVKEIKESTQEREYVKADIDNGYYRVANEIGVALCKTHLNDSEGRVVHTIMLKTFGWNKMLDWICYDQLSELTGISTDNISKVKKRLLARKIILTDGKKTGINPVVSEWHFKSIQTQNKAKKISLSRPLNKSIQTLGTIQSDCNSSLSGPIQKKDTITKDTITKDIIEKPSSTRIKKSELFKKFFKQYPSHRKGGTDAQAWKVWKSENIDEAEAKKIIDWLTIAAQQDPDWKVDALGQFVLGITKFLRDKKWLTPIPQAKNNVTRNNAQSVNEHNSQVMGDWLASKQSVQAEISHEE